MILAYKKIQDYSWTCIMSLSDFHTLRCLPELLAMPVSYVVQGREVYKSHNTNDILPVGLAFPVPALHAPDPGSPL